MGDLFHGFGTAVRALVVAISGVWLAGRYVHGQLGSGWQALGIVALCLIVAIGLGFVLEYVGEAQLPSHPVAAVRIMEWWTLAPLAIAVGAAALGVVVAIEWSLPANVPEQHKTLAEQFTAALGAFLASGFVSWTADQHESPVSNRIKEAFLRHFDRAPAGTPVVATPGKKVFREESRGDLAVNSPATLGIEGWGRHARIVRAKAIAQELRSNGSNP